MVSVQLFRISRYDNFIWKMSQATLPTWYLKRVIKDLIDEEIKYI